MALTRVQSTYKGSRPLGGKQMTVIDERLRLAAIGDMRAFEELYQHYHRRVFSLCLRMTGNGSEAEDLTRCFRSPFRNLKTFRGEASFYDLHRLTMNHAQRVRMDQGLLKSFDNTWESPPSSGIAL